MGAVVSGGPVHRSSTDRVPGTAACAAAVEV